MNWTFSLGKSFKIKKFNLFSFECIRFRNISSRDIWQRVGFYFAYWFHSAFLHFDTHLRFLRKKSHSNWMKRLQITESNSKKELWAFAVDFMKVEETNLNSICDILIQWHSLYCIEMDTVLLFIFVIENGRYALHISYYDTLFPWVQWYFCVSTK